MKWLAKPLGWLGGLLLVLWHFTCRYRVFDDPRPALRAAGRTYIYALLHAHQLAALLVNDDHRMAAMVSRSADGDILAPSLILRGVTPVRGSSRSRTRDKGGRRALRGLAARISGGDPALLAVDGPRGPRNHVHRGIADLAFETGAPALPVLVLPSRRWIAEKAWDRFQIPRPFCTVRLIFGPPVEPASYATPEEMRDAVSEELNRLEARHDPDEAPRG